MLRLLVDCLIKFFDNRQMDGVIHIIKLFSFFSGDQISWSQIIVREVVKGALTALLSKDKIEKKFTLALLYDISSSPIFLKIIKEISWSEGIGRIINEAFAEEPLCVSIIISNLHRVILFPSPLT